MLASIKGFQKILAESSSRQLSPRALDEYSQSSKNIETTPDTLAGNLNVQYSRQ